jgi:hypothetical protein
MSVETSIDPLTIAAYRESDYRIEGARPFTLQVGIRSPQMFIEFEIREVSSGAFITAWNPYSIPLGEEDNEQRDRKLQLLLKAKGYQTTPGIGEHPSNKWPGEKSQMVWSISRTEACELALEFQQNAFVWVNHSTVPELILMR